MLRRKSKIHYTSFPVASPQQVGDLLAASPSTGKLLGNWCNGFWAERYMEHRV